MATKRLLLCRSLRLSLLLQAPSGQVHGFDALLVGVYEKKELIFVAKVKNGFVPRIHDELFPAPQGAANCPVPLPRHRWTFSPPWLMEDLE
jgi:hypothetical protein